MRTTNEKRTAGKTLISKAVQEVQESIIKEVKSFNSDYGLCLQTQKNIMFILLTMPAGFKYDDLYTNILGIYRVKEKD
jgi:hypothetical protein